MQRWNLHDLVSSINGILPRFHYIILHITYKKGNKVADAFANWGCREHQLTLDTTWLEISEWDNIDIIKILIQKDGATLLTVLNGSDPTKPYPNNTNY